MTDMIPADPASPAGGLSEDAGVAAERERLARQLRDTRMQLAMTETRLAALVDDRALDIDAAAARVMRDAGVGGRSAITIVDKALVVLGPALKAFHADKATPDVTQRTDDMKKTGLALNACINTMKAQDVTLKDLLPGFAVADKGGVVRLAQLQAQGYAYLRP